MEKLLPLETNFFKTNQVYHLRITREDLDLHKTYTAFKDYKYVVVSMEGIDKKLHQHILIGDTSINKEQLTKILKETYPGTKGNKQFSNKLARNAKQLAKYVIKEEDFLTHGFSNAFITALQKLSYSTDDFKKKHDSLVESLSLDLITLYQYTNQFITLKCTHHQPIYPHHLKAHVIAMGIKTGRLGPEYITNNLFESIGLSIDD